MILYVITICSEVYSEDNSTGNKLIICGDDYDCEDLDYYICISGVCRCGIDYRLEADHCHHFICLNDLECQTYDPNRVCAGSDHKRNSSSCVCRPQYEYSDDKRLCQIQDNHMTWFVVLAFLPLLLILMSCWYCYKTAKSKHNFEVDLPSEPPTPQTPNIIITDMHSLQSYSNLSEFFMSTPKMPRFQFNSSGNLNLNCDNNKENPESNGVDVIISDQRVGLT